MYDQPRLETFEASRFFKDDASAREQPMGTVARDQPFAGDPYFSGKRDGEFLTSIPSPPNSEGDFLDRAFVERGRERFNIYCAPCHGGTGEGNGMIVQRGFPKPPSLHEERLREGTVDGQIFDVISNGFRRMPRYGPRIPADDRWRIVAYVRALQRSQHLPLDDAPADIRAQLERGTP
jgi:hypothetical protein